MGVREGCRRRQIRPKPEAGDGDTTVNKERTVLLQILTNSGALFSAIIGFAVCAGGFLCSQRMHNRSGAGR